VLALILAESCLFITYFSWGLSEYLDYELEIDVNNAFFYTLKIFFFTQGYIITAVRLTEPYFGKIVWREIMEICSCVGSDRILTAYDQFKQLVSRNID
jgi:hypothetical protein